MEINRQRFFTTHSHVYSAHTHLDNDDVAATLNLLARQMYTT